MALQDITTTELNAPSSRTTKGPHTIKVFFKGIELPFMLSTARGRDAARVNNYHGPFVDADNLVDEAGNPITGVTIDESKHTIRFDLDQMPDFAKAFLAIASGIPDAQPKSFSKFASETFKKYDTFRDNETDLDASLRAAIMFVLFAYAPAFASKTTSSLFKKAKSYVDMDALSFLPPMCEQDKYGLLKLMGFEMSEIRLRVCRVETGLLRVQTKQTEQDDKLLQQDDKLLRIKTKQAENDDELRRQGSALAGAQKETTQIKSVLCYFCVLLVGMANIVSGLYNTVSGLVGGLRKLAKCVADNAAEVRELNESTDKRSG